MKKTLFDKVWDAHIVESVAEGPQILYIDKHLIHEVTSPQAFNELKQREIPIFSSCYNGNPYNLVIAITEIPYF